MAKKIKTTSSKPGSLGSIYTGPKSQDPGVLVAQQKKAKRDSVAKAYSASFKKTKSTK